MRKFLCIGLLAATPWAFAAQEARELPDFKSIRSQGVYTLVVTAGQKQSVVVNGDESLLAKLSTTVKLRDKWPERCKKPLRSRARR